jgi:uncharacterized membrane protein YbhN (UPF0104 family)
MSHPDATASTANSKKFLANLLKLVLTLVILYFVARQVWRNWDQVQQYDWQIDVFYLVPSILFGLLALFIFSCCWRGIIGVLGHRVSIAGSFKIAFLSNLGRYIPGKVWQVFGMLYLAGKEGVPKMKAAASLVLAELFSIPASLLVYVLAAQLEPAIMTDKISFMGRGSALLIGGLMLSWCLLLILYPRPIYRLANTLLKKFGRESTAIPPDKSVALLIFLGYSAVWISYGLAFWLLLRSILGDSAPSLPAAIGLFNLAYQVGYLMLFAPGGFGPRELVMAELLSPFIGPLAPAVAILARLWSVLIESIAAVIALSIKR